MRTSIWIAIGLLIAVAAWLASGLFIGGGEEGQEAQAPAPQPTLVAVRLSRAEQVPQYIYAQGVAEPYRRTEVTSSIGGTLEEVAVQQGDTVEAGTVLARVRLDARESQFASARARVESLEADLQALEELEAEGFATPARLRELRSQLEAARAELARVREEISDTAIEAPIPGIVSDVLVNSGESVPVGTPVARIVDNAPLRVTLHISQRDVGSVDAGREAVVSFATGELARGRVCFVAPAADAQTRTFRVEIRVPNADRRIPSVVSTEVRFQTGLARAHFISPAILALSEEGVLGVKSVGEGRAVRFHPVEIVRAQGDGLWVGGLPEQLRLIAIGQGFVREGETVRVDESKSGAEATARATLGDARLPTATVESADFEGAEEIPEPPPAQELCRGTAANSLMTSSVPAGSSDAQGAPETSGGAPGDGEGAGQATRGSTATPGTGASEAGSTPRLPSLGPVSPEVQVPSPNRPSPQSPNGATQQGAGGDGPALPSSPGGGSGDGGP